MKMTKKKGCFSDFKTIRVQGCFDCPCFLLKSDYCGWYGVKIFGDTSYKPVQCKLSWNPWECEDNTIFIYPKKVILIGAEHKRV